MTIHPKPSRPSAHSKFQDGFTLLELVLALGIFSILLVILIGFYSRFVHQQRIDVLEQRMLENVRFAIDLFSREARTAYSTTYALTDGAAQGVTFRNQNGFCVHYRFTEDNLERAEVATPAGDCAPETFSNAVYQPLLTSDLTIFSSRFDLAPATTEEGKLTSQGYITLNLSVVPRSQTTLPVTLQTTVTSRQVTPFNI